MYVKGSNRLIETLSDFETTNDLNNARCAVIEMPGNDHELKIIKNIPVFVVITDILTSREWSLIQGHTTANLKSIRQKLEDFLQSLEDVPGKNEVIYFDDSVPGEEPQQYSPQQQEPLKLPQTIPAHRYSSTIQPDSNQGYIATSFSAAGGVGKTFTSTNIGGAAAINGVSTVVLDLDLGYGDVDTATGLVSPENRTRVVDRKAFVPKNGWATIQNWRDYARDLKGSLLRHSSGLYVLPSYPFKGKSMPDVEIEDLIHTLAEVFDLVMIDLGVDAFSPHSQKALEMSNTIFIIGGQDEKTLGKFNHFKEDHPDMSNMRLIINMVDHGGFFSPREVAKKIGFKQFDEIPFDRQGVNAAKKGKKLAVQMPGSSAGNSVNEIAAKHLPLGIQTDIKPKKSFFSFSGLKSILRGS